MGMTEYKKVRSTVRPKEKIIDEYSVWINTDIQEIEVSADNGIHKEYEFDQVQYSKDEYISMIDARNSALEAGLTDTQLALCEVYEMLS